MGHIFCFLYVLLASERIAPPSARDNVSKHGTEKRHKRATGEVSVGKPRAGNRQNKMAGAGLCFECVALCGYGSPKAEPVVGSVSEGAVIRSCDVTPSGRVSPSWAPPGGQAGRRTRSENPLVSREKGRLPGMTNAPWAPLKKELALSVASPLLPVGFARLTLVLLSLLLIMSRSLPVKTSNVRSAAGLHTGACFLARANRTLHCLPVAAERRFCSLALYIGSLSVAGFGR